MLLRDIIEGCKRGERRAQEHMYVRFSSKLFGVCMRYAQSNVEAEDYLQGAFIRIFDAIKAYKGQGSLEGWLKKITVNYAIDQYRKRPKIHQIQPEETHEAQLIEPLQDPCEVEDLLRLIRGLPDGYRLVFNLYAIEGYSHAEIAVKLKISEGTSKSQLSRARQWLRASIKNDDVVSKTRVE